jgi:peptidoglycan/xylan/chitin deacetylase (PgdA/CDA1 family)
LPLCKNEKWELETLKNLRSDPQSKWFQAARALAKGVCYFLPIPVWSRIFPQPILCMCYHMVSDAKVPHVKHYPFLNTTDFESDLKYLRRTFDFISYEQMLNEQLIVNAARRTSVCLSFDDGFIECYDTVRPILLRYKAPCIFFVVTDLIDNRAAFFETQVSLCIDAISKLPLETITDIISNLGLQTRLSPVASEPPLWRGRAVLEIAELAPRQRSLITWLLTIDPCDSGLLDHLCQRLGIDVARYVEIAKPYLTTEQLLQLRSDGFTIGAHSCSHRRLQELSLADAEAEIVESCRVIQNITGQGSVPFAFPYSGSGIDRAWLAQLRKRHDMIGLFFDTQGLKPDVPFVVQRVFGERVGGKESIGRILRKAWRQRILWARQIPQLIR